MKSRFLKIKRAATWQSTRKSKKKNQNGEHMGLHEERIWKLKMDKKNKKNGGYVGLN